MKSIASIALTEGLSAEEAPHNPPHAQVAEHAAQVALAGIGTALVVFLLGEDCALTR